MKYITITLNPFLDRTLVTHHFCVGYHNSATEAMRLDPAGRGVNIARALYNLRCDVEAIILLGDDIIGHVYKALISEEKFKTTLIGRTGATRSQTVILDTGDNTETLINEDHVELTKVDIDQVVTTLQETVAPDDIVVLAGSLPQGVTVDAYARLIHAAHQAGAQIAVAGSGPVLEEALKAGPEMVAMTQLECESHTNLPMRAPEDVINFARKMYDQGAESVMIELREKGGAILVIEQGTWEIDLPDEPQGTSSGMWDAMFAGFLYGYASKTSVRESIGIGAAAAAYTSGQVGDEFGSSSEIKDYLSKVDISQIAE